jgi:AcrR family transcriptional regulator
MDDKTAHRPGQAQALDATLVKSHITDVALVQRRRAQIVDAAIELFSQNGFYPTTIQEVARKAGVSIGLIYQYARTKEDVLLLSLLSVLEAYRRELPGAISAQTHPLDRFHAALDAYCRVIDGSRQAAVLAYLATKSLPKAQRELVKQSELETNELIAACIRECIEAGFFREIDVSLAAYQVVTFAHTWALKHWALKDMLTIDGYVENGLDFFVRAFGATKGLRRFLQKRTLSPIKSGKPANGAASIRATVSGAKKKAATKAGRRRSPPTRR